MFILKLSPFQFEAPGGAMGTLTCHILSSARTSGPWGGKLILAPTKYQCTVCVFPIHPVAARVAMMQEGQIVIHSDIEDLKEAYCRVHVHSQTGVEALLKDVPGCLKRDVQSHSARLVMENMDESWYQDLSGTSGIQVEVERLNLDEIFLALNT